jgi:hypothetical protein
MGVGCDGGVGLWASCTVQKKHSLYEKGFMPGARGSHLVNPSYVGG